MKRIINGFEIDWAGDCAARAPGVGMTTASDMNAEPPGTFLGAPATIGDTITNDCSNAAGARRWKTPQTTFA